MKRERRIYITCGILEDLLCVCDSIPVNNNYMIVARECEERREKMCAVVRDSTVHKSRLNKKIENWYVPERARHQLL
jgi:hypothetical protein